MFASLFQRVKPINQQELYDVATTIAAQGQTAAAVYTETPTTTAAATTTTGQAAETIYTVAPTAGTQIETTETETPVLAQTSTPVATANVTTAAATTATAATASTSNTSGAVDIPSSSIAPRTQYDYWTKHIAQFAGKYLPDGPSMRPNCGPASVTMALRMIGLDIPGFSGQNSEAVLDQARILATGKNDTSVGTTDTELETLLTKSGAKWSESTSFDEMLSWVKQGIPVVMSGNPSKGWNDRYTNDQVYKFDGGHWVTVSGYDSATGNFIVNDPLSQIGPIYVSEAELKSFNQAHGNLGIAVFK